MNEALPGAWSRRPGHPGLDPALPEDENNRPDLPPDLGPANSRPNPPSDQVAGESVGDLYPPQDRKAATSGTRTRTSGSTGDADPKLTAELVAAALGVAIAAAAFVVQLRRIGGRRRRLREPTDAQLGDMAAPLGRIAQRHLPVEVLNKDLIDGLIFAGATGRYLRDGDLLVDQVDAGIPPNLQDEE